MHSDLLFSVVLCGKRTKIRRKIMKYKLTGAAGVGWVFVFGGGGGGGVGGGGGWVGGGGGGGGGEAPRPLPPRGKAPGEGAAPRESAEAGEQPPEEGGRVARQGPPARPAAAARLPAQDGARPRAGL